MADAKVYEPLEIKNIYELERCPIINKTDYLLFKLVHSLNVNGKSCYASNSYLTERCGCNTKAIQRSIVKLIKLKLLKRGHNPWGSRRLKTTYLYLKNDKVVENKVDNDLIFDTLTNLTYSDFNNSNKTMDKYDHNTDISCSDTKNFDFNSDPISDNIDLDRVPDVHKYNNIIYNKIDSKLSIDKLKDKSFSTTKVDNYDTLCYFKNENNKRCNSTSNPDCSCYEKIENEKDNNACAYATAQAVPVTGEAQVQAQAQFHTTPNDEHIVKAEQLQLQFTDIDDEIKPNTANQLNENNTEITQTQNINGDEDMEFKKTDIFGNLKTNTNTNTEDNKTGLDIETKSAEPLVMSIKVDKNKSGLMKSHIKQNRVTTAQKKNKYVEFCEYAKTIGTNEQLTFSIQRYVKWLLGNRKVDLNQWQITIDTLKSDLDKISSPDVRLQAAIESFDTSYASGYVKLFIDKYKYNRYMNNVNANSRPRYGIQNSPAIQSNSNTEQTQSEIKDVSYATSENGKPIMI